MVNDNHDTIEDFRRLLDALGHIMTAVHSASQGLASMNATTYDIVLLSMDLRGIRGLDALPVLRHYHPTVPIIALTAAPDPLTERQARSLGASDVLLVPVGTDRLAAAIDCAIDRRPRSALRDERNQ
jgi:CheY-like chemotaxis protein